MRFRNYFEIFNQKLYFRDLGYGAFENCLPVTILTSRTTLQKAFGCSSKQPSSENLHIMLVGVYQFPINYTLTLWTHGRDDYEPALIKSVSNSVLFMDKPFTPKQIAVKSLTVSQLELQKLTRDGTQNLSCQILFH